MGKNKLSFSTSCPKKDLILNLKEHFLYFYDSGDYDEAYKFYILITDIAVHYKDNSKAIERLIFDIKYMLNEMEMQDADKTASEKYSVIGV